MLKGRQVKSVLDTTLRDGEQAPGNEMSLDLKSSIFRVIDETGVDYIEIGFPASSRDAFELAYQVSRDGHNAKITVFARALRSDIDTALESVRGDPATQLQLLVTGSEIHAEFKRGQSPQEALDEMVNACRYSLESGVTDLSVGFEDSLRASPTYLDPMLRAAADAGATMVVLADTVGGCVPTDIAAAVRRARTAVGDSVAIHLHCHNDLGLALANAVEGLRAGADGVQCTVAGIGERTGNTALEELAAVSHYHGDRLGIPTRLRPRKCADASYAVLDAIRQQPWKHKPLIGDLAFSTAAGIHAKGLLNEPICYEFVEPSLVGRERRIVLGSASGRANLRGMADRLGLPVNDRLLDVMYDLFMSDPEPARYNAPPLFRQLYDAAVAMGPVEEDN